MAFKNMFNPNVAAATKFLKTTSGFTARNGSSLLSAVSEKYVGDRCLSVSTQGSVASEGVQIYSGSVGIGDQRAFGVMFKGESGKSFQSQLGGVAPAPTYSFVANGNWQFIPVSGTFTGSGTLVPMLRTASAIKTTFYLDCLMLQTGLTCDPYEFPGIDLTGNSIQANTNVNNVKLENIIKAFGIESTEHVNNLTLQNILTLTNIPTEEYVNNIELLNEIILEAIENTTSVHDAVIYIKCNYMNVKFEMKYPSTSFKLKQPHTAFKMKYP